MSDQHKTSPAAQTASLLLIAALGSPVVLAGCSMSFWKTAEAAESAIDETSTGTGSTEANPDDTEATIEPIAATESAAEVAAARENPDSSGNDGRSAVPASTPLAGLESPRETLRTCLSRTSDYRKLRTRKSAAAFAKEATFQIDLGLAAATAILTYADADLMVRREAWKGRLTLLNRGEQLKLPGFAERLDKAIEEATSQPDFQSEAEYGSGLVLLNRHFKSGSIERVLEQLQQHAHDFPEGASTVRLFLTFARDCGERGRFGSGILCCRLALWQLHDHPDIEAVRNLLENLQAGRTVDPSEDRVQQKLEEEVALLRHELPIRIDRVTTCTLITTAYHEVTYRLQVTLSPATVRAQEDKIKSAVTNMARTTYPAQELLEKGVVLRYVYIDRSGNELLRFDVSK
jgi:outer membrane murein-binding lipoprotein Lpp